MGQHRLRLPAAVLFAVLAAGVLAGCGPLRAGEKAGPVPAGSSSYVITVDGIARSFVIYRPPRLSDPAPLVLMLHGGFGSARQAERSYGWDAEAHSGHFLVAYPDGLDRAWNTGGGCCGRPAARHVNDVAFLTAVVKAIERRIPVDRHRIFATGISNGGIMAYALACRTTIFAAIAPDSATELGRCTDPRPLSVLHIHGTADHNIPYNGGPGDGPGHIDGPSVRAVNAAWRRVDHCAAPRISTRGVVTTSVAACRGGRVVELITISGAGHQWPGSVSRPLIQRILHLDPPSRALDATAVIWRFFAAHPSPGDRR